MTHLVRLAAGFTCAAALAVGTVLPAHASAQPLAAHVKGPQQGDSPGRGRGHHQDRIAFWQYDTDVTTPSMITVRADGSGRNVLHPDGPHGALDYSPHWDATGRHLTFFRVLPGAGGEEGSSDVRRMRADGSHAQQLTHLGDGENPVTSPDGTLIAFEREVSVGEDSQRDVGLIHAAGSHLRNLTRTPDTSDIWPRWTSRGHRLTYSTEVSPGSGNDVVVNDLRGHVGPVTTDREATEIVATFSPRDRDVAYTRIAGTSRGIYVQRVGGKRDPRLLVAGDAYADWSPDDRRLAVVRRDEAGSSLITVRPGGGRTRAEVTGPEALQEPDWSPGR